MLLFVQCARQGFALGLAIVVGSVPAIRVDSIMKLVVQFLEVSSSRKGQVCALLLSYSAMGYTLLLSACNN